MLEKYTFKIYLVFILLFAVGCELTPKELASIPRGSLIELKEAGKLTTGEIIERVEDFNASEIALNNVTYYTVSYATQYLGESVEAFGLLLIPDGVTTPPLINYTHGTLFPLEVELVINNIPSNYRGQKNDFVEVRNISLALASNGYAVFMPDYIGYGKSRDYEHPYVYYPELFNSILDGIRAARNALEEKGFVPEKKFFLAGWSQGAGASLSTHKFLEKDYSTEFEVVASSNLAGPYNFYDFVNFVFVNRTKEAEYIGLYTWTVYAVNKFSTLKRPTDQLFSFPVFSQISALLAPSKIPQKVFNTFFLDRIVSGKDVEMINVLKDNSTHDNWSPSGKVFLHHGDADRIVPYFNSVDAFTGLTGKGGDIKLYSYPNGDHDTEVGNFVLNTITDFNALK